MIALRDMRPEDRDRVRDWRNLPAVAQYMYTDREISADEHARWFERVLEDPTCSYWVISCDRADVGLACITGIDRAHSRCSWAFYIASSDLRGRGVGSVVEYSVLSHVFDRLGLEKLCCEVLDLNAPVIEMHKRFGFSEEGRLRRHIRKGDQWHDVIVLAMLRENWLAVKPGIEERLSTKGLLPDPAATPAVA